MTPGVAALRRRVLRRLLPALGPRWALVADGDAPPIDDAERGPAVSVAVGERGDVRGDVCGDVAAWPVLSEAVTGALVAVADGGAAARACREASRVLQPGGVAVFLATWPAGEVADFDRAVTDAGLRVTRRFAVRRAGAAPSSWAWLEARRAARATGDARIECAVVARRAGGTDADLPTAAGMLSSLFVPRAWRRDRR